MQLEVKLGDVGTVMRSFLGWHDLVVRFPDSKQYGIVGRGSMTVVTKLTSWSNLPSETPNHIFTVGRFCEFAGCKIVLGGEHENGKLINTVFGDLPLFLSYVHQKKESRISAQYPGFFEMGNAVVVSEGVIILGGNKIGDGVVVGAGTVVPKSIEPYQIVYGNPPVIKTRQLIDGGNPKSERWWELSLDDIAHIVLGEFDKLSGKRMKMGEEPFVVVQLREQTAGTGVLSIQEIVGFQYINKFVSFGAAPAHIKKYFTQMRDALEGKPVKLDSKILNSCFS